MKIINFLWVFILFASCSGGKKEVEQKNKWKVDISGIGVNVEVTDISKDFYNLEVSVSEFRKKYPFFLDNNFPDNEYNKQRKDTTERNIYNQITEKVNKLKLKTDLESLFRYIKYYYPEFKEPKVFLYSSFCQDYLSPITYIPQENYLFIASDCFLGYGNKYYDLMKIDRYLQQSMSQEYLASKVAKVIINASNWIPRELSSQAFVSRMIYQGKILTLEDAFLPETPDEYKIEYTKDQLEWAKSSEFQIWNFFVENNYVFSDELSLDDRFLALAPFSKFYTEADGKSPGRIGCWTGWQICRKYLQQNPKVSLQDFIKNPNGEEIFSKSKYKPEQIAK